MATWEFTNPVDQDLVGRAVRLTRSGQRGVQSIDIRYHEMPALIEALLATMEMIAQKIIDHEKSCPDCKDAINKLKLKKDAVPDESMN